MKTLLKVVAPLVISFSLTVSNAQTDQPMIGQVAPSFTLKGLDGKTYSLEQFKGKYVVLHIATTWCPFCNAEAPHLEQLYKDYQQKGVQHANSATKNDGVSVYYSYNTYSERIWLLL